VTDGDITTIVASIFTIIAGLIGGWAGAHFTDKRNRNLELEKNR
jgi:LytS/YehU family sensor histidine kinase